MGLTPEPVSEVPMPPASRVESACSLADELLLMTKSAAGKRAGETSRYGESIPPKPYTVASDP